MNDPKKQTVIVTAAAAPTDENSEVLFLIISGRSGSERSCNMPITVATARKISRKLRAALVMLGVENEDENEKDRR